MVRLLIKYGIYVFIDIFVKNVIVLNIVGYDL